MFVIAGVTGHVGSVVAERLLGSGQKVRAIVRSAEKGAAWIQRGAELAVGTLDDEAFLSGALHGASGFFTLLPPNFQVEDFFASQCATADAIAGAVYASGVPHVVILSSIGADLSVGTGPIKGLHYLEDALRRTGVKLSAIRASYFQENVGNALRPAREMGVFPNFAPSADRPMHMVATRDIGDLAAETLLAPPAQSETIDLQGPAYSIHQVADKLGAALGKPLQVVNIPPAGWVDAIMKGGMPLHAAEVFAEMYRGFASGAIIPKGDRMVHGRTEIDEVINAMI